MTTKETYLSTQSMINRNATAEVHNIFQTYEMNTNKQRESKRVRTICQPKGTVPYTVEDRDTIEKIALQFNSTPSELLQLNKLHTRMLFPGQVLYVPEERPDEEPNQEQTVPLPSPPPPTKSPSATITKPREGEAFILLSDRHSSGENISPPPPPPPSTPHRLQQDIGPMVWSMTRQLFARPGRAHRLQSDSSIETESTSSIASRIFEERSSTQKDDSKKQVEIVQKPLTTVDNHQVDDECLQRFIKLNARLMTNDRKNVSGTLLVTPNALMFDPDVLDPQVKEHGIDKYGLIIQMNLLAGIALYEDFSMFEHQATARDEEKRKMCSSTSVRHSQQNQLNYSLISDHEQIHDLMNTLLDTIEKDLNDSSKTETCILFHASPNLQRQLSKNVRDNQEVLPTSIDNFDIEDSFQPLNDYKHSIGILLNEEINNEKDNYNHITSQDFHLENCVPIDQFNKRFDEIDKLLYEHQQSYFAPQPIEIPYYLCIKTSVHKDDIPSLNARKYKKTTEKLVDTAYGKKQLEYKYWFAIPKEKADHLYKFFLRWTPERELDPLIDDIDELARVNQSNQQEKSPNKGFVLLTTEDPDLSDDYLNENSTNKSANQNKAHYLQRQSTLLKEWEVRSAGRSL